MQRVFRVSAGWAGLRCSVREDRFLLQFTSEVYSTEGSLAPWCGVIRRQFFLFLLGFISRDSRQSWCRRRFVHCPSTVSIGFSLGFMRSLRSFFGWSLEYLRSDGPALGRMSSLVSVSLLRFAFLRSAGPDLCLIVSRSWQSVFTRFLNLSISLTNLVSSLRHSSSASASSRRVLSWKFCSSSSVGSGVCRVSILLMGRMGKRMICPVRGLIGHLFWHSHLLFWRLVWRH